jgi:hypothetical protein
MNATWQTKGFLVIIVDHTARKSSIFSDMWPVLHEFLNYHQSIIDHNQNNEEKDCTKLRTHAIDTNPRIGANAITGHE